MALQQFQSHTQTHKPHTPLHNINNTYGYGGAGHLQNMDICRIWYIRLYGLVMVGLDVGYDVMVLNWYGMVMKSMFSSKTSINLPTRKVT